MEETGRFIFNDYMEQQNGDKLSNKQVKYPTERQSWGLVGLFMLASIVVTVALMMPLTSLLEQTRLTKNMQGSIIDTVGYMIPLGFVIWFGVREKRKKVGSWSFSFKNTSIVVYGLLIVVTVGLSIVLEPMVELIPMPDAIKKLFETLFKNTWLSFVLISLVGPVMEELLMRGIILDGLLNQWKPKQAILFSALLFGIIHLNPWQFIPAFAVGLVLGWIYWQTQSLWPCIFIHVLNNSLSSAIVYFTNDPMVTTRRLAGSNITYYLVFLCAAILFAGGLWALDKYFNRSLGEYEAKKF